MTDQLIQELRLTIPDHPLIPLPQQGYWGTLTRWPRFTPAFTAFSTNLRKQ